MKDNCYNHDDSDKKVIIITISIIGIIALLFFAIFRISNKYISIYNELVELDENVKLAKFNVEDMMQRRIELIPDLAKTVKAAAEHEEKIYEIYEKVSDATYTLANLLEDGDVKEISEANNEFSKQINNLLTVVVKNHPEVTAGEQFTGLMDQIEGSINRISIAREKYNEEVSKYNKSIRKSSGIIVSKLFEFKEKEYFEADEEAKKTTLIDWDNL